MLGRLCSNPNVLDQSSEATIFEVTLIFETKGRPLKYLIPNDRLPKATEAGVYPRSAHVRVIQFQIIIFAHFKVI